MHYCLVADCQRKCHRTYCAVHNAANSLPQYSYRQRVFEYCDVRTLAKLTEYFPLAESPEVWRRGLGEEQSRLVVWRGLTIHVTSDGRVIGNQIFEGIGKVLSVRSDGWKVAILTEDYQVKCWLAMSQWIEIAIAHQKIVQIEINIYDLYLLTERGELYSVSLHEKRYTAPVQQYSDRGIRLIYTHPSYDNLYYLTFEQTLYADDQLLGCEDYSHFGRVNEDTSCLTVVLRDGTEVTYPVPLVRKVSERGILL